MPASANRPSYPSDRMRFYAESPDLMNWTPSNFTNSFWTSADENDPPYVPGGAYPQLYNLDAVAYESVLVGMFSWFNPGPASGSGFAAGPDLVELGVGFSRDGFNWVRPTRGGGPNNAFIPASNTPGTWNVGNTQSTGGGFLVVGDQLWFYFSGRDGTHCCSTTGYTGLATLRRDGFYSMDATGTATLTTRPLQFVNGRNMFVNVRDPQGSLQIQLINPSNNQVLATSNVITADSTIQPVTWVGVSDLSSWMNQPVQLQFTMTHGELYSFWVSPTTTGASNGYVAAGGPGYATNVDTAGTTAYSAVPNGGSTLSVSSNTLYLTASSAGNPPPEILTVTDLGGTLSWTVTANQPWITLSSTAGSGIQSIAVGASITGMAPGTYPATLAITGSHTSPAVQTVNVTLTIQP